ncbi:MAG TPA: hypothetical protein VFH68_20715 [Polyangia bacterium]|jgi:hypothetical protein|nr:hypothetical protein [Polyangia bacterium]
MRNLPSILFSLALSAGVAACNGGSGGRAANDAGSGQGGATGIGGSNGSGSGGLTGSTGGNGGTTGSAGSPGTGGVTTPGTGGTPGAMGGATGTTGASVLLHHNNPSRDGVYVDARLTRAAAATMHVDTTFANVALTGPIYAQPLYLAGGTAGPDALVVASANNRVTSLNGATGARLWEVTLGTPVTGGLCGRPLNPMGIVGTPVIDAASRTIYLSAMTAVAAGARHMAHALAIDSQGAERTGWPVDLNATARSGNISFDSPVQNQRAAAILLGDKVFIPFGGHIGDCDGYHGWIVGITTTGAPQVSAWSTTAFAGGIWGSSGIASDGTSLIVTTGNTKELASSGGRGTSPPGGNWGGGEAVIKFPTTLVQPVPTATREYFVPSDWINLDLADADIGGSGPILLRVPGATPSNLIVALGKDGKAYLLDAANLGGLDAAPLTSLAVANGAIIQAAVAYTTATASYVVFRGTGVGCPGGQTGGLTAIKVSAASPPVMSIAWCAGATATSSPAVSVTDAQGANAVVWYVDNTGHLRGLNGDTGASVLADTTALGTVMAHQTPIVANGRIFVASNSRVFAFTP